MKARRRDDVAELRVVFGCEAVVHLAQSPGSPVGKHGLLQRSEGSRCDGYQRRQAGWKLLH